MKGVTSMLRLSVITWFMMVMLSACLVSEQAGEAKFAFEEKKLGDAFYSSYKFSHPRYNDVRVAIKVTMKNNAAIKLELLNITKRRDHNTRPEIETATLGTTGRTFSGDSTGAIGGKYTGTLQKHNKLTTGCCGKMTFIPSKNTSIVFTGEKIENLSANDWNGLTGADEDDPADGKPSDMTIHPVEVGQLFFTGIGSVAKIEAHSSDGKMVSGALARWKTDIGADHFAIDTGNNLYVTQKALDNKVTHLKAHHNDGTVTRINLTVRASSYDIVLKGGIQGSNSWVAFSRTNQGALHNEVMEGIIGGDYEVIVFDSSKHVRDVIGFVPMMGEDQRGFWIEMSKEEFACQQGAILSARVYDYIFHGKCG